MFDIIVVGGGPVGSEVAFKTASAGYSVAVLEQRENFDSMVCCTGIVSLDCINSFAIDRSLIRRELSGAKIFSPSGNFLRFVRKEPVAFVIDRAAFDGFMAERAKKAGAIYLSGYYAESVALDTDNVEVAVKNSNGSHVIDARAAVVATGAISPPVREFPEYYASDFVSGAQAEVEAPGLDEVEVYCGGKFAPGFFAWLVPTAGGKALAGLLARKSAGNYMKKFVAYLYKGGRINTDKVDIKFRGIALKTPEKTFGERIIVVGGAAGQVKPTTGGGIYFGLLAADMAANTLGQAIQTGDLSAGSLSSYESQWKDRFLTELNQEHHARVLYEHLNDIELNTLFRLAETLGVEKYLSSLEDFSFDWHSGTISKLVKKYYNI